MSSIKIQDDPVINKKMLGDTGFIVNSKESKKAKYDVLITAVRRITHSVCIEFSLERNFEVVPLVADAGPNSLSFLELLARDYYFSFHSWLSV